MNNLPNIITTIRIALAPVIAVLIWYSDRPDYAIFALVLFILASISDWLDGYLARQMEVISPLGRMLDPIADKLLIGACLISLAAQTNFDLLFLLPALIIILREFLVSGLREHLAGTKITLPVSLMAKWKTAVQMTAIGCLISIDIIPDLAVIISTAGITLLWLAAFMTAVTGLSYFKAGISSL